MVTPKSGYCSGQFLGITLWAYTWWIWKKYCSSVGKFLLFVCFFKLFVGKFLFFRESELDWSSKKHLKDYSCYINEFNLKLLLHHKRYFFLYKNNLTEVFTGHALFLITFYRIKTKGIKFCLITFQKNVKYLQSSK